MPKFTSSFFITMLTCAAAATAASLSGTVIKAGSLPFTGQKVRLYFSHAGVGGSELRDSAMTDGQGKFAFAALDVGFWLVKAEANGYRTGQGSAHLDDSSQAETADIVMRTGTMLSQKGSVTGTVLVDTSGSPLAGVKVVLSQIPEDGGDPKPVDSAMTNAAGRYLFDSVAAGSDYQVSAKASGYDPQVNTGLNVTFQETTTSGLSLAKAGTVILLRGRASQAHLRRVGDMLEFSAAPGTRRLKVFTVKGALVLSLPVPAGAAQLRLPASAGRASPWVYFIAP
jgi:5-hydroxyisourate hydrolase-like protein (transthyretin family)